MGRVRMRGLAAVLLFLSGCWTLPSTVKLNEWWNGKPELKPPSAPEEYKVPPADDPRFSTPIEYPKGTLNQDLGPKRNKDAINADPSRFGGGGAGGGAMRPY
jgi:hypothetical protein